MISVSLAQPGEVPESVRTEKMWQAEKFASFLNSPLVLFAGVTGSVSYVPRQMDDVDLFIISRNNGLWRCMFRAYLTRFLARTGEVCLSLNMDMEYALSMFSETRDPLVASDSVHVVPILGRELYGDLLSVSPYIAEKYPRVVAGKCFQGPQKASGLLGHALDWVFFIALAPAVYMKALIVNWFRRKNHGLMTYRIVIGRHCLFFDNLRYEIIRKQYYI